MLTTDLSAFTPRMKVDWLTNYLSSMKAELERFGATDEDIARCAYAQGELEKAQREVEAEDAH